MGGHVVFRHMGVGSELSFHGKEGVITFAGTGVETSHIRAKMVPSTAVFNNSTFLHEAYACNIHLKDWTAKL